ncbi:MAG: hypothetical protein JJ863_29855 [Deltaproteobacteria bacterium]|nr:hypothetical protein [Deltaproteobacteria bacterium]
MRAEDAPEIRLANACLLTLIRERLGLLRVDVDRGAIEMTETLGAWRPFTTVPSAVAQQVADRLRLMAMIPPLPEHEPVTGRITIVLPDARHRFEAFSFHRSRNLVVVRFLSAALLERTWPWPDPPRPEPEPLERGRALFEGGDLDGAMGVLRDYAAEAPAGPESLTAFALMAAVANEQGHLRVRLMIDEERLAHARKVPGAAYDVIEGLLFTGDVRREEGDLVAAEARVVEALELAREVQPGLPLHLGSLELLEEIRKARGDSGGAADAAREHERWEERLVRCPAEPDAPRVLPAVKGIVPDDE